MWMEVKKRKATFHPEEPRIPYKTYTIIKTLYSIISFFIQNNREKAFKF